MPHAPSRLDGTIIALEGELLPGNQIRPVNFPENAFAVTAEQVVPKLANVDSMLVSLAADRVTLLPLAPGIADTEKARTHYVVRLPHRYIHLVIGRGLTPRKFWTDVIGPIMSDGLGEDCKELLNWARISLTNQADDEHGNTRQPATFMPMNGLAPDLGLAEHTSELL